MHINFTGIRNTSFIAEINPEHTQARYTLYSQLTDDDNGNDLTEYRKLIDKMQNKYNMDYEGTKENTMFFQMQKTHIDNNHVGYFTILNNKEIEINDSCLPIFDYLAKFTKSLYERRSNEEFKITEEYALRTEQNQQQVMEDYFQYNPQKRQRQEFLNEMQAYHRYIHAPNTIKAGAEEINDDINNIMISYFA